MRIRTIFIVTAGFALVVLLVLVGLKEFLEASEELHIGRPSIEA